MTTFLGIFFLKQVGNTFSPPLNLPLFVRNWLYILPVDSELEGSKYVSTVEFKEYMEHQLSQDVHRV